MWLWRMIIYPAVLVCIVQSDANDCIQGETWYQKCKKCTCLGNGQYSCVPHSPSCNLGKCVENVVIFHPNLRCHCTENKTTVCVNLSYQQDLDGKPCSTDYYYYDNCTYCKCDQDLRRIKCSPIHDCTLSNGGICNEGEEIIEHCFKCHCTFTKFRVCFPIYNCFLGKEKPGKCYSIQRFYPKHIRIYCTSVIYQECYSDYGCPGGQKCCQVVDCYLRCVDPVF